MLDVLYRLSCNFLFVQHEHDMHQSHWGLRMLIRSMEDASASLNAEASHYVVGREAACQISVPVFSISAPLPFSHVCCHF